MRSALITGAVGFAATGVTVSSGFVFFSAIVLFVIGCCDSVDDLDAHNGSP